MGQIAKLAGTGLLALAAAGCVVAPGAPEMQVLPKGEPLDIRNILAAHPNKRACVAYLAATNSCASIITSEVDGDQMVTRETSALKIAGTLNIQTLEVVTRSHLHGARACVRAGDIGVTGRDAASAKLQTESRALVTASGGSVCSTYFRAGDGYVMSRTGANGAPVPPGDTRFQFVLGDLKLRAQ